MKKVLVIEPYYGGSHKQFLQGLSKSVEADYTFLTLPARKWKMRMQLSAPWFAHCIDEMAEKKFDTMLCSTFVDVSVLTALLRRIDGWDSDCRICTYFHENQFIYPSQVEDKSHHQFTSINFTTALVSDGIAFNSRFNLESFIENAKEYLKKASDMSMMQVLHSISRKSEVLYPGIDFTHFYKRAEKDQNKPVICWNHRWEHDKNPEEFFYVLQGLQEKGVDFRLIVLGQSFNNSPSVFDSAREKFNNQIIHFGYADSREEYIELLHKADIVVSTSIHEFFGISVIEAIRAGSYPLLPNRLSYPELYPEEYLYRDGELENKLASLLKKFNDSGMPKPQIDTDRFDWSALRGAYEKWLFNS